MIVQIMEAKSFKCFVPGETHVYGEGCISPTIPAGGEILIYASHDTLKKLTGRGGGAGQPEVQVPDAYA